eukprot:1156040-Pelagomonas_calceolata.AAC.3
MEETSYCAHEGGLVLVLAVKGSKQAIALDKHLASILGNYITCPACIKYAFTLSITHPTRQKRSSCICTRIRSGRCNENAITVNGRLAIHDRGRKARRDGLSAITSPRKPLQHITSESPAVAVDVVICVLTPPSCALLAISFVVCMHRDKTLLRKKAAPCGHAPVDMQMLSIFRKRTAVCLLLVPSYNKFCITGSSDFHCSFFLAQLWPGALGT